MSDQVPEAGADTFQGGNDTEKAILDAIDREVGVPVEPAETETQPDPGQAQETVTRVPQEAQQETQPTQTPQEQAQPQQQQAETVPANVRHMHGAYASDDKGNAVDPRSGAIIAHAGRERSLLDRALRAERAMRNAESDVSKLRDEQVSARTLDGLPQKLGLDKGDIETGLSVVASFKKDPVGTARYVLTETMKQGHTLQTILGDAAQVAGLDMGAVKSMVQEAVAPLVDANKQTQAAAAEQAESVRQYNDFLARHEFADVHQEDIATLMEKQPSWSAEKAYYELRLWAGSNGFDFAQPLAPQIQAKQAASQPQPQPQPNGAGTPRMPMPAGTGVTTSPAVDRDAPTRQEQDQYGAGDPWSDIIRTEFQRAGYRV